MRPIGLAILFVVLGHLVPVRPAAACSVSACGGTYAAPNYGIIPSGATALVYKPPFGIGPTESSGLRIEAGDGTAVAFTTVPDPATPGHFLVNPTTPLEEGKAYRLISVGWCNLGGSLNPAWPTFNQVFSVGPPSSLPARMGTVTVHPSQMEEVTVGSSASCTEKVRAAVAVIELHPPPELSAHIQLMRRTLKVDGEVWISEEYGSNRPAGARSAGMPFAVCDPRADIEDRGLAPGTHTGEMSIHVAGAASDPPPVRFTFDLACTSAPPTGTTASNPSGCAMTAPAPHELSFAAALLAALVMAIRIPRRGQKRR
jgi:hypothetical protein